jgi:hypothetical protein
VGVRYDLPVEDCAQNELHSMENCRVGTGGEVEQRKAFKSFNSLGAVNSGATLTMSTQFDINATTDSEVIVAGNKIYDYSSSVWTDRTNGLTVSAGDDNRWDSANGNGTLFATSYGDSAGFKISGGAATALDVDSRFTNGRYCAWFDNRAWIGNVSGATGQLWYSDIADIETWGATSFYNFGGIITALVPGQNVLVVHTTDGIYTLSPTGNADLPYIANKQTRRAAMATWSVVGLPDDTQVMVREDGIYEWSGGAELTKISQHLDGGYWPQLNQARLDWALAEYFPRENEVWFALPYGTSQTNMNHIIIWNKVTRRWYGPYTGFEANTLSLIDGSIHRGDFDGFLMDHDATGDADKGTTAIDSNMETGAPPPLGADVRVRWVGQRHFYDGSGNYDLTITQQMAEDVGWSGTMNLAGDGFELDSDPLDLTDLAEVRQLSQDLPMTGYAPQSSVQLAMNQIEQTWKLRKSFLRYKPLGRFLKQLPSD